MTEVKVDFRVNGHEHSLLIEPGLRLIDVLRDKLNLTGTKEGCGEGECGACTVIMDGKIVNSCLVMAFQAQGKEIITIEGIGQPDQLHPIQEAFLEEGAVQCGFCTPGMVLAAKALLDKNPRPTPAEIRRAMAGNLCRCTGYDQIIKAVEKASQRVVKGA